MKLKISIQDMYNVPNTIYKQVLGQSIYIITVAIRLNILNMNKLLTSKNLTIANFSNTIE